MVTGQRIMPSSAACPAAVIRDERAGVDTSFEVGLQDLVLIRHPPDPALGVVRGVAVGDHHVFGAVDPLPVPAVGARLARARAQ